MYSVPEDIFCFIFFFFFKFGKLKKDGVLLILMILI